MKKYPFPLKPMSTGNILDYTFRVYRSNFVNIIAFSILVGGLFNMLLLIAAKLGGPSVPTADPWTNVIGAIKSGNLQNFSRNFLSLLPKNQSGPADLPKTFTAILITYGGAIINYVFIYPFVQGGISNIVSDFFHGRKNDVSGSLSATLKNFGNLVLTALSLIVYYIGFGIVFFIVMLIFVFGSVFSMRTPGGGTASFVFSFIVIMLFIVAIMAVFMTFITFVYPSAVSEGKYHFDAISRSFKLTSKKFWRVLGINILVFVLVYIIIGALQGITFLMSAAAPVNIMFRQVVTTLISSLITPVIYIAGTLLYFDTRIRVEGYDLELGLNDLEGDDNAAF